MLFLKIKKILIRIISILIKIKKTFIKIITFPSKIKLALTSRNTQKVFCIGRNKTGTTSLAKFLSNVGITVGKQRPAELLFEEVQKGDFSGLIKFVKYGGKAFQDNPFSLPGVYKTLDKAFPNSKFILTVRDSSDQWYNSVVKYHSKLLRINHIPTKEDLLNATYVKKGWMWKVNRFLYQTPEDDIYNEEVLKKNYTDHNNDVIEYFKNRPQSLLVINVKDKDAGKKICEFLGTKKMLNEMPWENKT